MVDFNSQFLMYQHLPSLSMSYLYYFLLSTTTCLLATCSHEEKVVSSLILHSQQPASCLITHRLLDFCRVYLYIAKKILLYHYTHQLLLLACQHYLWRKVGVRTHVRSRSWGRGEERCLAVRSFAANLSIHRKRAPLAHRRRLSGLASLQQL